MSGAGCGGIGLESDSPGLARSLGWCDCMIEKVGSARPTNGEVKP